MTQRRDEGLPRRRIDRIQHRTLGLASNQAAASAGEVIARDPVSPMEQAILNEALGSRLVASYVAADQDYERRRIRQVILDRLQHGRPLDRHGR